MNKVVYVLSFLLNLYGTSHAKMGKITIIGQVENHSISNIKINHLNKREVVTAELDTDGNFKMVTKIESGFYVLSYDRHTTYIYLFPKDELQVNFDANNFMKSLVFEGKGASRNNYLIQKEIIDAKNKEDLEAFYKVSEQNYLKNLEDLKNKYRSLLETYSVEDFFKKEEEKSLEYERLLSIQNYANSYKFYLGEEIIPSEDFYAPIKNLSLDDYTDYSKQPYFRYLVNSIWSHRIDKASDAKGMLEILGQVPSQDIAISLVTGFYSKISSNKEKAKEYLDLIKMVTKHQPFIEAAEKQYREVMNAERLSKGTDSPQFSYENIDGKTVSLSDFLGKYVYIDIWATWCAPCIKQIPYLKELEKRYEGKNIAFVSISVDKEVLKGTWKQMVLDKELGGVQLFADQSFDSEFMNAYAVNSIPRFILIDPKGKITDAAAPRPSFDKTVTLLDQLLEF